MLALIGRIASRYVRLRLRGGIYRNPHKASPNLGSVDVRDHEEIRYEEVSKGMKTTIGENADNGEIRYEKVSKGMKTTIGENADLEETRYEKVSKDMKTTSQDIAELLLSTNPLPLPRS